MSVNLILWICVIWLPLLVCLILCNEAKMKKSIVVGVTLPREALEQEQPHLFLKQFKSCERWVCLALLLAGLPGMLIRDFDWMMFVWGLWVIAAIAVPYILI